MIEPVLKIRLNESQYNSLCFLANHNEKEESYITDTNEAFKRYQCFISKQDALKSIANKVNYIMFTKSKQ